MKYYKVCVGGGMMLKKLFMIAGCVALCSAMRAEAKPVRDFDFSDKALDALTGEDVAGEKLREKQRQKEEREKAKWDKDNETASYVKKKKKIRTAADVKKEEAEKRDYKKSTYKRKKYAGPTYKDASAEAEKKAMEAFKTYLPEGDFDFVYESENYRQSSDILIVKNVKFVPKKESQEAKTVPYYLAIKEIKVVGFNLGQIYNSAQKKTGLVVFAETDFPIYNEKKVKTGQIKINRLEARGKSLAVLKKGQGVLTSLKVQGLHNEKIINEVVFNDIVRSKIFAIRFGTFRNITIPSGFADQLKEQSVEGFSFSSASVDSAAYTSPAALQANVIKYSARVFDANKLAGAQIEAKKKKREQVNTDEQFRKNAQVKESAVKELEKQLRP